MALRLSPVWIGRDSKAQESVERTPDVKAHFGGLFIARDLRSLMAGVGSSVKYDMTAVRKLFVAFFNLS